MKNQMDKPSRGGQRPGAGRKPNPYKTISIAIRIPAQLNHEINLLIKQTIKKWKQNNLTEKEF
jgi:hypothetical protein